MDIEEQRAASRERWEGAAAGWESHGAAHEAGALPVAHRMVDRLRPQPGETVLELGAGMGDVGFLAAELVHPGGKLISTDGAEAMVEGARRRAEQRGITNAEFRPMEIEWLDLPTASVDGILARFAYMLVPDPEAGLREARRVLKPGGRIAIAVWDRPEANPHISAAGAAARELGLGPAPDPSEPGPFALSEPGAVQELLEAAGFADVEVEALDLEFSLPSLDAWWDVTTALSPSLRVLLPGLSPADTYRLRDAVDERWRRYVRDDGAVVIPGRALVAAASA
jgi:SAM-dependent methyltransferase